MSFCRLFRRKFHCWAICWRCFGVNVYEWALTGPGRMASTRVVGAWSIAGERVNSTSPPLAGWYAEAVV